MQDANGMDDLLENLDLELPEGDEEEEDAEEDDAI